MSKGSEGETNINRMGETVRKRREEKHGVR